MMLNKSIARLPARLRLAPALAALCAGALLHVNAQAQAQAPTGRIGFIYTERLMTESKLAKKADEKIQAEFSKRQKQVDDMVKRFKSSREKFDEDAPKLNDIDRTRRTRELLDMEKDVQRMQREFNEDLLQRKNEERAAIAARAFKLIEQVAKQEHLDVVLQEAIWASPSIDITDKILKLLDR
jgi:outer membrane protein